LITQIVFKISVIVKDITNKIYDTHTISFLTKTDDGQSFKKKVGDQRYTAAVGTQVLAAVGNTVATRGEVVALAPIVVPAFEYARIRAAG
jgi:hypothetical protein